MDSLWDGIPQLPNDWRRNMPELWVREARLKPAVKGGKVYLQGLFPVADGDTLTGMWQITLYQRGAGKLIMHGVESENMSVTFTSATRFLCKIWLRAGSIFIMVLSSSPVRIRVHRARCRANTHAHTEMHKLTDPWLSRAYNLHVLNASSSHQPY